MAYLTESRIRAARASDKPYKLFDERGLHMLVTPQGGRLWRLRYWLDGREKLLTLGAYPDVPLKRAREKREEARKREQMNDRVTMLRAFALQAAKAQNWPEAIDQMQQAIHICGQCAHGALLHKNLAFFYRGTGRISDAKAELEKAIALDPNDNNARKALAALQNLQSPDSQYR